MTNARTDDPELRVLILAPSGRDAALAAGALQQASMGVRICADMAELCAEIDRSVGAVLLTEEGLTATAIPALRGCLSSQPPWSDLPIIVFTSRRQDEATARRSMQLLLSLGNVTALERPVHPVTLVSAVEAALRARGRQYQARETLLELERQVRQRDQFLAMLGHELRNPLGAISNAVQIAQRVSVTDEHVRRQFATIDRQAGHLAHLVDDLLDVARITSGKVVLNRQPVEVRGLIGACIDQMQAAFDHQRLHVHFRAPDRAIFVSGDKVRLEQVITNVLVNALKYTPSGGRIEVGVRAAGDRVEIQVTDTGIGIPAEAIPHIFDLFNQGSPGIDRAQGGLGIGLTLVRTLLTMHGGAISVHSRGVGHGATFIIQLPRIDLDQRSEPAERAIADVATLSRHILLVEDNADNRETLGELLQFYGHRVDVAVDGLQGVERALSLRPEVAVIDIGLPGLDGFEVARRIRTAMGSAIVLIALTGYGQPEDKVHAIEAGFDMHLTKPINVDKLQEMLVAPDLVITARPSAADRDSVSSM